MKSEIQNPRSERHPNSESRAQKLGVAGGPKLNLLGWPARRGFATQIPDLRHGVGFPSAVGGLLPAFLAFRAALVLTLVVMGCVTFGRVGRAADFESSVSALIPRLSAENVGDRYAAQMELQALAAAASKPGADAERVALGKLLAAKVTDAAVPQPARSWFVRQLEYMGGSEAVEALSKLMGGEDQELRESARRALEKNPSPEAGAALREALGKVSDPAVRTGVINSLGVRRDAQAVARLAKETAPPFADAARLALGRIGTREAVEALLAAPSGEVVNEALIRAANLRLAENDSTTAKAVFTKLYSDEQPAATRAAALFGLAKASPSQLTALVTQGLNSSDRRLQLAALNAALAAGAPGQDALGRSMPQLNSTGKLAALRVLDATGEKQIVAAAANPDEPVRLAALEALGRVGGTASVSVLLTAATTGSAAEKAAAATALTRINGPGAGAILERNVRDGDAATRAVTITALSVRRQTTALPAIVKQAADPDPAVRKAALAAIGKMGSDGEVEPLAQMALQASSTEASAALAELAARISDKPAASRKLLSLAGGSEEKLLLVSEAFAALGDVESIGALARLTASTKPETQTAAVEALGGCSDLAAARALLNLITSTGTKPELASSALQAAARVVRAAESAPPETRGETALALLAAAKTTSDKRAALGAIGAVPFAKSAPTLKGLLTDAEVKKEAGAAALSLAEGLRNSDRGTARDLARAVLEANLSPNLNTQAQRLAR